MLGEKAPQVLIPTDPMEQWELLVEAECIERHNKRLDFIPHPSDQQKTKQMKAGFFVHELLPTWANDPHKYIKFNGWAPDPVNRYGASAVPAGLSPKGMVPMILFDKHRELIAAWWDCLTERGSSDIFGEKSRQEMWTTLILWLVEHAWRFHSSFTALAGSYDNELIDKGGKGQRDATSLFGRLRLFIDCFVWAYPHAKFNAHLAPHPNAAKWKKAAWLRNATGMQEAEDISFKLSRPKWIVHGVEIFPGAEGNWIQGALPSDKFGRTYTATVALLDELYHYNKHLGAGKDREAYGASAASTKVRVGWGTPPRGGAIGTYLYDQIHSSDPHPRKRIIRMHWTNNSVKMHGAAWLCRNCGHFNKVKIYPPPAWPSEIKQCEACAQMQNVRARGTEAKSGGDMTSDWYKDACARSPDKEAIAAELDIDHVGAASDVVFSNVDVNRIIVPRAHTNGWTTIHGYDPGYSEKNPAAWTMWRYSPALKRVRLVAYHQAANWPLPKWVPFLKCWSARQTQRMVAGHAGYETDFSQFDYSPEELEILDRISQYSTGRIEADKYGSHRDAGNESAYDVLENRYTLTVHYEYVTDDELLIQKVRDVWVPLLEIDPEIADYRPEAPAGHYPSFLQALMTAKWAEGTGHREEKRIVSNKEPPHVKHFIDTLKYVVRELDNVIAVRPDDAGEYSVVGDGDEWLPGEYEGDTEL